MSRWPYVMCATAFAVGAAGARAPAQIQYATGQNVAPIYEGWMRNADGTIDMWFGYLNRNWEEVLHVPVGPDNHVQPGGPDRGQPPVFVPRRSTGSAVERREQFVFGVRLPAEWDPQQELVWTVTANGRTDRAVGTLRSIYELDNSVIGANRGGGGPTGGGNKPPTVKLGVASETITLPGPATLRALVRDDGLPRRPEAERPASPNAAPTGGGRMRGLHVNWVHYRGPGRVRFEPSRSPVPTDGKPVTDVEVVTTASFSEPGTFMLRAVADDGSWFSTAEVTVNVVGPSPTRTSR